MTQAPPGLVYADWSFESTLFGDPIDQQNTFLACHDSFSRDGLILAAVFPYQRTTNMHGLCPLMLDRASKLLEANSNYVFTPQFADFILGLHQPEQRHSAPDQYRAAAAR